MLEPIWVENKKVFLLDQRRLPKERKIIICKKYYQIEKAIRNMAIRGAPAIGIAVAYGLALGMEDHKSLNKREFLKRLKNIAYDFSKTRPTAINLFWGINRIIDTVKLNEKKLTVSQLKNLIWKEAKQIHKQDINSNIQTAKNAFSLFRRSYNVLTHCNTGALATGGYGTALGVIRYAFRKKKIKHVFVDETRPQLQGARLTAWELKKERIPFTLVTDNMAGYLMKQKDVDMVIVGADRVVLNGDIANKIGTYSLAVLCHYHKIPFYVVCPSSTIDTKIKKGKDIPIESRSLNEIFYVGNQRIAPERIDAINPAFDVTPAQLITAIITEKGVFKPNRIGTHYRKIENKK